MKTNVISFLALILLLPLASASYTYVEDADNSNTTVTGWEGGLTVQYDRPNTNIFVNESYWSVKHGLSGIYNISLSNCAYNSSSVILRMMSRSDNQNVGYSGGYCLTSGGTWLQIGQNQTTTSLAGSWGAASSDALLTDGDYNTGVAAKDGDWDDFGTYDVGEIAAIYEEGIYWYTGDLQQVVFTINNEFGRAIEGADVSVIRLVDSQNMGTETTDVTGKVLYTLTQGQRYNISVSAGGYQNISGVINIIEQSYTLTLTVTRDVGNIYYGVFQNITFITSPTNNPDSVNTNFSLNINSSDNSLEWWGVSSVFNGTSYIDNNTGVDGGEAQITIDLTGHDNESILVSYFMKKTNSSLYSQNHYFVIGTITGEDTSASNLLDDYSDEFDELLKSALATIAVLIVIIGLSAAGLSGDLAALVGGVPLLTTFLIAGWIDPVYGGIAIMGVVGWVVMSNRGGGS